MRTRITTELMIESLWNILYIESENLLGASEVPQEEEPRRKTWEPLVLFLPSNSAFVGCD